MFTVFGAAVSGKAPSGFAGLIIGFIVYGIIILVGPITGASLNPARELGPALLGQAIGAAPVPVEQLVVVYIVGSIIGGVVGAFLYEFIGREAPAAAAGHGERRRRRRRAGPAWPIPIHGPTRRYAMATNAPSRVKKLINDVEDIVPESLAGLQAAHPDLVKIDTSQNLVPAGRRPEARARSPSISGGGSGHEPLHGGFVGLGMLDAAAAGNVFTSPVPDQMEAATRAVDGGAGVLHIVKNYTGDVLNFQLAAELVAGEIEVATVVTNDDVAVQDSLYTAGRRGVGVHRAAREDRRRARRGRRLAGRRRRDRDQGQRPGSLDGPRPDVVRRARRRHADVRPAATTRSRSASASTASPADGARSWRRSTRWPSGSSRRSCPTSACRAATRSSPSSTAWAARRSSSCTSRTTASPRSSAARASRSADPSSGNYITSLEMAGFSVTLLRLDDELTRCWDAPVHTPALRWGA